MKTRFNNIIENSNLIVINILLVTILLNSYTFAQLPTAVEIASKMKVAWNIGNTLEVPGSETLWGNPKVTQQLIDAVSEAGFNTIRIPCAWDSYADQTTLEIDSAWLARVKEVIDYCYANEMYVMINVHWDGGWLENNVTAAQKDTVNFKQNAYWTQIANYFKDYDEHLLFASANEPNVDNSAGMNILLSYHQSFIDAVRKTGGNNSSRTLIIQGPSTDIDKTYSLMNTMPTDSIEGRLMAEIHYYTPWNFCGLEADAGWGDMFFFWGAGNHSTTKLKRNASWGEETALVAYMGKMKTKFVDKGIPVILGEFGAIKRTNLTGEDLELHIKSREYFNKYVTQKAIENGLVPVYWDNGYYGLNGFAIFDRNNGDVLDQGLLDAIIEGANTPTAVDDEDEPKVGQNSDGEYIFASPNPALASSVFHVYTKKNAKAKLMVYNILGKEVAKFDNLNFREGMNSVKWNTGNLAAGTYFVRVNIGSKTLTNKLLIIK